jgi:tungstate transport system permease protein
MNGRNLKHALTGGQSLRAGLHGLGLNSHLCKALHIAPSGRSGKNRAPTDVCDPTAPSMDAFSQSVGLALNLITQADATLWRIVGLSLRVSATACCLGAGLGLLMGAWLAVARFRGHGLVVGALNTLLALPSVVVGLSVYLLLSRSGPLGSWGLLFTPTAMVIAQSVLVVPLIAALSRQLVSDALREGGDELQAMGASRLLAAVLLLAHERVAVFTVLLTAFGRAVAEVGAVMIVGGNIDGVTRVMTTAIALETSKGDLPLAMALGLVLLGVVALINLAVGLTRRASQTPLALGAAS